MDKITKTTPSVKYDSIFVYDLEALETVINNDNMKVVSIKEKHPEHGLFPVYLVKYKTIFDETTNT